jgi:pimeloyl-ACP methyl ester carboxylesterase
MTTSQHNSRHLALVAGLASIVVMLVASPAFRSSEIASFGAAPDTPWRAATAETPARATRATQAERSVLRSPAHVQTWKISYSAHEGTVRNAYVVLPAWYGPDRHPPLPLIISPHGRGLDGESNARLWGDLPALGSFAVVNPDGQGRRLGGMSWGAQGQIDDLARMPDLVAEARPWLSIDKARVYAVGGSMGGQETLLLVARHPELLAGAAAVDAVTDFPLQYRNFPRLGCNAQCRRQMGSLGLALQARAREEIGGTPASAAGAYARRSPLTFARAIAHSCVPLQVWWSRRDKIVIDGQQQSGRLVRMLRAIGPRAQLEEFAGRWIHTAVLRADRQLPLIVERLGLLPDRWGAPQAGLRGHARQQLHRLLSAIAPTGGAASAGRFTGEHSPAARRGRFQRGAFRLPAPAPAAARKRRSDTGAPCRQSHRRRR